MYCKVVFDIPLDRYFDYRVPAELSAKVKPGLRVTAPFGRLLTTGLITSVSGETSLDQDILMKDISAVLDERPVFGSDLFPLAQYMKETWGGSIGQILFSLVPPQAYFKLLPDVQAPAALPEFVAPIYTDYQKQVFNQLNSYLSNGFHWMALNGADSTAKKEILRHLIYQVLQNYGQALLTVPDVLATQNLAQQLEKHFGKNVFCWHSKMLLSRKKQIFSLVSQGVPCLIVSARSGGFLPFKNLRLAVILEEENESYKQEENKPYFHLRDLLACRARQHEALFITASNTPSLETLYAIQHQQAQNIDFPLPVAAKPQIKLTTKKGERSDLLSDPLIAELESNLQAQQPALLILNRRGYANAYYCLNCGTYAKCKECGTILSREKDDTGADLLICKKCGHTEGLEQTCPKCQNKIFKSRGGGTQKIVTELNKLLPTARVVRLDSDTLRHKDGQGYFVRQALEKSEADIVVGTRLALDTLAVKSLNLAAILDADLELDSPDFRASEQFGQLLFKLKDALAVRPNGRLMIQAASPDIYPFEHLEQTYQVCAQEELAARQSFHYPPYVCMVKVLLKAKDATLLEAETARVMSAAAPYCTDVLGPVKTGKKTDTLLKQYILFKTSADKYAALVCELDQIKSSKKTDLKVFADPYNFY